MNMTMSILAAIQKSSYSVVSGLIEKSIYTSAEMKVVLALFG